MIKNLASYIHKRGQRFSIAVDDFELSYGRNAYPERSVSQIFISALQDALPRSAVLLEVPVRNPETGRADNHLDALVFNNNVAVLAEFKRAYTPDHWKLLANDAARTRRRVAKEIESRFDQKRRRKMFALYGLDCWRYEVARSWKTGEPYGSWHLPRAFSEMKRFLDIVWRDEEPTRRVRGKDYDGHYLTWAVERLR